MQKSKLLKIQKLRRKYPRFIYEDFSYKIVNNNLEIIFSFKINPDIFFSPKIIVRNIDASRTIKKIGERALNNLIFNLGLIEMPSYWKATCSPEIVIKAGRLNREQIKWWKNLIIKGMGQFFYENKIDWRSKSFLTLKVKNNDENKVFNGNLKKRYLLPFGGGRDSIVSLEKLQKKKETALFMVNPSEQILKTARVSGIKKQIIVKRVIDKKLLQLNKKGFLNGHTPFTAVLSFLSVFTAVLFDYKNIVFSNEKSADEGNLKYLNRTVNHQWAKSSEFERMFKEYCKKYLAKDINYFSYLRAYGELEISKMFVKYQKYFPVFSSCNSSMKIITKKRKWCGNCPKCLFVYLSLYPFLEKKQLLKIFGKDVFENKKMLPTMKSLIEQERAKPFECVGTKKESQKAFKLSLLKVKKEGKIPYLLTKEYYNCFNYK